MADNPYSSLKVDLAGQTAIVTGASQGLGKTIALALAASGAKVACIARSADKLKDTVTAIMREKGFARVEAVADLGGNDRVLVFVKQPVS